MTHGIHLFPITGKQGRCVICGDPIVLVPPNREACDKAACKTEMQRRRDERARNRMRRLSKLGVRARKEKRDAR